MGKLWLVLVLGFGFAFTDGVAIAQTCRKGCPCGNSCISCAKTCHKGPGTAHKDPVPPPAPRESPKAIAPSHDARVEFASTIGSRLQRKKIEATFRLGDPDTSLLVTSACTKEVVERLRNIMLDEAKAIGFLRLLCENKSASADF
jgi:hypothetical protein